MDEEIKAEWVAALRSGEYKQGAGQLAYVSPNGNASYCCLGVLCDLLAQQGRISQRTRIHDEGGGSVYFKSHGEEDEDTGVLPKGVAKLVGLGVDNPAVLYGGTLTDLASLNDGGASFKEIADLIEREL